MSEKNGSCMNPSYTENGYVACRTCWKCRENRTNEKVGRMIAESKTSVATYTVTLTYKTQHEDDVRPHIFHGEDVTLFLKRLRKTYGKVRYAICGERGDLKGRVHFHAVLFFQDTDPHLPLNKTHDWSPWPHGHSFFQEANPKTIHYAMKYAMKESMSSNEKTAERFRPRYSLKPALGHTWLQNLAIETAKSGVKPQGYTYHFGGKKPKKYLMTRVTRDHFMNTYVDTYFETWGTWPHCDAVDEHFENEQDPLQDPVEPTRYNAEIHSPIQNPQLYRPPPEVFLWDNNPFELADILSTVYVCTYHGLPLIAVKDPKGITFTTEQTSWREDLTTGTETLKGFHIDETHSYNAFRNSLPPARAFATQPRSLTTTEPPF